MTRCGPCGLWIVLALAALCSAPTVAADQAVWPLTPYRMQIITAVAPRAPLTPRLEAELCDYLSARIEATIGAAWDASVAPAPTALRDSMLHGLQNLDANRVPPPPPEIDKIMLLTVTVAPDGLLVTARITTRGLAC